MRQNRKRLVSGFLAAVCFCLSVLSCISVTTFESHAATFHGKNIWTGGAELLHGRNRKWMYKWTDGWQMTFCITPRNHMGDTVVAQAIRTNIADSDIPYIKSKEDYEKLAIICTWFDQNGSLDADNATYAAAQTAVWAVMEDGWEKGDFLADTVDKHIAGTKSRWKDLKAYVEGSPDGGSALPDWCKLSVYEAEKNPQKMTLENGVWTAELDISKAPELASINWTFEGDSTGWKKEISGGKMIFRYEGASQTPSASLSAILPDSLKSCAKNTTSLNLYIPDGDRSKVQAMISAGPYEPKVYLKIGGTPGGAKEELELKIYRHTETFSSHYLFDLEKYCAETGQALEGSIFRILEAFDGGQTGGLILSDYMVPKPALWSDFKICTEASTDTQGHFAHMDEKEYEYSKTYCDGHPEPEYLEVPEVSGGENGLDNSEEIAAIEAANENLRAQWEALAAACEEETDFHSMEPGEGLEMMLADRDASYEEFIGLKYDYTVEEIQARYGYILHGRHNDDEKIPVVRISSSESGAAAEIIEKTVVVNETAQARQNMLMNYEESGERQEYGTGEKSVFSGIRQIIKGFLRRSFGKATPSSASPSNASLNDDILDSASPADGTWDRAAAAYSYTMERSSFSNDNAFGPGLARDSDPGEDPDSFSAALPEPEEDDVAWMETWGTPDENAYTFSVSNHRTEGEIHINKRDLELSEKDLKDYDSYGDTQGDATLEGAVYGLFAAEDIIHPDGKTGTVYKKDELTAIATTDKNGDASFLAYTEGKETWIGHPLILGNYYIREISRSEGYELSVDGRRHPVTNRHGRWESPAVSGRAEVTSAMTHPIDMHDGSWLEFDVTYQDTKDGFDIFVSGYPEGSSFYRSAIKETTKEEQVVIGSRQVPTGEYEKAEAGEYRLDDEGNYIQVRDGEGNPVWDTDHPATRTYYAVRRLDYYPHGTAAPEVDPGKWSDLSSVDTAYVREETNAMLKQMGYQLLDAKTGGDAPWTVLTLSGTTNRELTEEILEWYAVNSFWDSAAVHEIREVDGHYQALIFHDYQRMTNQVIYETLTDKLYVRLPVDVAGETVEVTGASVDAAGNPMDVARTSADVVDIKPRHMFAVFEKPDFSISGNYAVVFKPVEVAGPVPFGDSMEDYLSEVCWPLYEQYQEGDYRLDGSGNRIPVYRTEFIYEKKEETTSDYELTPLEGIYDVASGTYRIHVENTIDWNVTAAPVTETFRAVAGKTSMVVDGTSMFYSDYLSDYQGAGASAAAACTLKEDSYGKVLCLTYPGQISPSQDGTGTPGKGTRRNPVLLQERIIKQAVKVTKDISLSEDGTYPNNTHGIHEDWFTRWFGGWGHGNGAGKMSNFRFKIYLKNNLKRLFRDADGNVVWMDRRGREIDVNEFLKTHPSLVPDLYTKVPRNTDPLYKNSDDAINANDALYDYTEGLIHDTQNPGYTAILEQDNYEKFFDALRVANQDRWDDQSPFYTSFRPIGNEKNRTEDTIENSKVSDNVRQFAIRWYLDDEVKKQKKKMADSDGNMAFGDELYDTALFQAIVKAENYLKPFFSYDLDEIYAISWDSEADGGKDRDKTTLSADVEHENFYAGTSEYLPYGTYVVVEQQPRYNSLQDFKNRHFEIDEPKEIVLPAVYDDYETAEGRPEGMSGYYRYDGGMTPEEMAERYKIRFCEEIRVVKAHNHSGDFELYPYGMDIDHIKNGIYGTDTAGAGDYFALTQDPWKPYKNYYNEKDDRREGEVPYYLSEGQSGRTLISGIYRYSSVSEQAGKEDGVSFMEGMQTACEGQYAPALVPWSMEIPANETEDGRPEPSGESKYLGFAYADFQNRFYSARLRIEKLDSETHENLLHDGAIFRLYAAERDASEDGTGDVKFYEKDTVISGSKEFLESMGASGITPMARMGRILLPGAGVGDRYTGVVPAGTPICREEEMIWLSDRSGAKVGVFQAYTTTRDGQMEPESHEGQQEPVSGGGPFFGDQNAGYLETPGALGAGVYVLAEVKAPAGYARTKPMAIEIYSDKVAYYKEGNRQERVAAAIYEDFSGEQEGQAEDTARIYVENAPTRLLVEKQKESSLERANTTLDRTVTWKFSTRVDGSLVEIGNDPNYEYAYKNGEYQGYGWKKGTLEYLNSLKEAGEDVEIVYEGSLFAGYGYITRKLETADDANSYVAGALMTLFEAIPLQPSGDTQDFAYEGLKVERAFDQTVTRMYVQKGYGGTRTQMVQTLGEEETPVWTAQEMEREDTDILYYDLGGLDIFSSETGEGGSSAKDSPGRLRFGYDRNHKKISLAALKEGDSIFAFRGGVPYLELVGTDFTGISYLPLEKRLEGNFRRLKRDLNGNWTFSEGVCLYHLDRDGNRDSLVDPATGMAYVAEEIENVEGATGAAGVAGAAGAAGAAGTRAQRILVWPVKIARDSYGTVTARDKITTFRIATVGESADAEVTDVETAGAKLTDAGETGYVSGSWKSDHGEESHQAFTIKQNRKGQNLNEELLITDNSGTFVKAVEPVLDEHGMVQYYKESGETYHRTTPLYDRNGDRVREKEQDLLDDYNQAAYVISEENGQEKRIFHRQGEAYILENTWITGEKTPNDPFSHEPGDGQADILKRVPAGTYIMEEIQAPEGYIKGFPAGVTVEETKEIQTAAMTDYTTKLMIGKADGTSDCRYRVLDMSGSGSQAALGQEAMEQEICVEGAGAYGQTQLPGAKLALYEAVRVYTSDLETYPSGYYLKKKGDAPFSYVSTDSTRSAPHELTAQWVTEDRLLYLEGIPAGEYLLEELETPEGFVTARPLEVIVENTREVQNYVMYNDHTKLEVEKYTWDEGTRTLVNGAGFTLYPALTDSEGRILEKNGQLQYEEDNPAASWESSDGDEYAGFITAFEEMYREYGTKGRTVMWEHQGNSRKAIYISHRQIDASAAGGTESMFPTVARLRYRTEDGKEIRVTVYGQQDHREIRDFVFEYQFDYQQLSQINDHAVSYLTSEGMRRLDYLPVGQAYVLVETKVPAGFAKAEDQAIYVKDTPHIQRYHVQNQEGTLIIAKTGPDGGKELAGAHLVLYRAGAEGELIRDETHLAAEWISGQDGVYTELEEINHQIPEGYKAGDLRPHSLRRLPDGVYYLVELTAPEYYTLMEPQRIEFRQQDQISVVRAVNVPAKGEIELNKTDVSGNPLSGAVFQLSAYRTSGQGVPDYSEPVFTRTYSEHGGNLTITGLPVGEPGEDGKICPYRYRLKETTAPDGYQVSAQVKHFQFEPDKQGISYGWGESARETVTLVNEKTRVLIQKKKFDFLEDEGLEGAFIKGAQLAVYAVTGRGEQGQYLYDETAPLYSWTTDADQPTKVLEGLSAGRTYLLTEQKAPEGYSLMKPIAFTLSLDGRKIVRIGNDSAMITVGQTFPDQEISGDAVDWVTIHGRYGVKVEMSVTDSAGKEAAVWTADGNGHLLYPSDQIQEGDLCTIQEICVYSDGTRECTMRTTRRAAFGTEGWQIPDRTMEQVALSLTHEDGTPISQYQPTESRTDLTIENETAPENPKILMYNRGVRPGSALDPNQEVFNRIIYVNTSHRKADLELVIRAGDGTRIVDAGPGTVREDGVHLLIEDVNPQESGTVTLLTEVEPDALESRLSAVLTIRDAGKESAGKSTQDTPPQVFSSENITPILQKNRLTVFQELTGSGKEEHQDEESRFEVRLYTEKGEELKGRYAYCGSRTGSMKSGDTISLAGNEYITINPGRFYETVRYQVRALEYGGEADVPDDGPGCVDSWNMEGQIGKDHGACAVFTREVTDPGSRLIFAKDQSYVLTETTRFSDGTESLSSWIQFALDGSAAVQTITGFDRKKQAVIGKQEITGEKEVPGALLQIRDKNGQIVEEWISGMVPHRISADLTEGETYILHEETAPDGYGYASDIAFTMSKGSVTEQVVMTDQKTKVVIRKTDLTGEKEVPGARLKILDAGGAVIEEWVSGTEPHEIVGKLIAGETYHLHEESAPAGFEPLETDLVITVPKDGTPLQVTVKNKKKPSTPTEEEDETPEEPETPGEPQKPELPEKPREPDHPETRIGRITASYGKRLTGKGRFSFGGFDDIPVPKLGDDGAGRLMAAMATFLVSLTGLWFLSRKEKRRKKMNGKLWGLAGACILMTLLTAKDVRAESSPVISKTGDSEITVTWPAFVENAAETLRPKNQLNVPGKYEYEGHTYSLKSRQLIAAMTEEKKQEAETSVMYRGVEQADTLPDHVETEVTDEDTGLVVKVDLPAADVECSNWRWVDGFEFPITVQQYDAGQFYLGELVVTENQENSQGGPFSGYEKELLGLIGVDPDFYFVEETRWVTEPWTGEDGLVYRQARALGRKYVSDCNVTYKGEVTLPSVSGQAWQAVYVLEKPKEEIAELLIGGTGSREMEETDTTPSFSGTWIEYVRTIATVTIGIAFLIGILILWRMVKKHRENRRRKKQWEKQP